MTKPENLFFIFQLFLPKCVPCTLKTLLADLGKIFGALFVPQKLPFRAKIKVSHDTQNFFQGQAKGVLGGKGQPLGGTI